MAFTSIPSTDIEAGDPVDVDLMTTIKDDLDYLYGASTGAVIVPNGDFEIDSDADTLPDQWDITTYAGGTAGLETTAPIGGANSLKFVHPGGASNGGGYADSDYIPCAYGSPFGLSWMISSSNAATKNQVIIRWFDEAQVFDSATTVYDSVANPTSAETFYATGRPPSGVGFFKIRLVGGENSVNQAGTILFDKVQLLERIKQTQTLSGATAASVDFTDISPVARQLRLTLIDVNLTGAGNIGIRVSADNGSTWISTSTYMREPHDTTGSVGAENLYRISSSGTEPAYIVVDIFDLNVATQTIMSSDSVAWDGANFNTYNKLGGNTNATAYNAIQIVPSSSTIANGTFILEEIY